MKLLNNVLVVIAATGVMGSAQAQTPGNIFNLGTLSPTATVTTTTDAFASGSFSDTFNFTLNATHHIVTANTTSTNVSNLQLALYNGAGTLLFTGLNLQPDLAPGDYQALISGTVGTGAGNGEFTFSVAPNPEPAEWTLLLCGLVVAGFIARRKVSLVAG